MEISDRLVDNCVVLDIQDDKFGYPKTLILKNHVMRLIERGYKFFVLNLEGVEMMDSFGIAVLISVLKMSKSVGGNVTLFGLNDQINRLIELTHMDRVLDIWDSEAKAVSQAKMSVK